MWLSGVIVMGLSAAGQRPDGAIRPHYTEFRVVLPGMLDGSGDLLPETFAVVGVDQCCKPLDRLRKLTELNSEENRALLIGRHDIRKDFPTKGGDSRRTQRKAQAFLVSRERYPYRLALLFFLFGAFVLAHILQEGHEIVD